MKLTGFMYLSVVLAIFTSGCQSSVVKKYDYTKYDRRAKDLVAKMTLDEKIGQMIQAETTGLKDISDIENYHLGSILAGGNADPKSGNSPEAWTDEFDLMMSHSMNTRLKIPLVFGIDAVHGHSNVKGAVLFPHNIGLGCSRDADLVQKCAGVTAAEMRATGVHWTFAPCVTVPQDERWGRTYEGFSEDPKVAAALGAAAVKGFQGKNLSGDNSVLACVKHYVGDGGTAMGTSPWKGNMLDQGDTQCSEQVLRDIHLYPYGPSVALGVGSIMPSYSSWNGVKCSASKYLLTDVLKGELGFDGFLISDYNAIKQIDPDDFKRSIGISVNAGMDMAMEPTNYREFFKNLKELVEEGVVPVSRIDDAVTRILRVKIAMGLLASDYKYSADRGQMDTIIGCEAHREVARQAVRESLVLLKNDNDVLPLSKTASKICIAGRAADDIGLQCGGWTISWQGQAGNVTEGTTVLEAFKQAVSGTTEVVYSKDGSDIVDAEYCVVVIGEDPYAEGEGDNKELTLKAEDIETLKRVSATGVKTVVVLFSGRPVMITDLLPETDAFVAAWLPGTEGAGITDVLFGDYNPVGKLAFTWPASVDQIPVNVGDGTRGVLFNYDYGLTY